MKNGIPFVKYTSCGNNFVIVDEVKAKLVSEAEMSDLAYFATNVSFGVGSDNLLIIQPCTEATLKTIAQARNYWDTRPHASEADFIFRMFEPSGDEALCCGNGLICVAHYLKKTYGIDDATILIEIPFAVPRTVAIGSASVTTDCRVNLGHPRRAPAGVAKQGVATALDECIDLFEGFTIDLTSQALRHYTDATSLTFSGYLVFAGEPHLVIFPDQDLSVKEFAQSILGPTSAGCMDDPRCDERIQLGSWLVHHIGCYINTKCRHLFPAGLNVNFARLLCPSTIEYRCFERGIDRETLACGTGAVAVACVAKKLHNLMGETLDLLPHRCRWDKPDALIRVRQTMTGWQINATPTMLFEGIYRPATRVLEPTAESETRHEAVPQRGLGPKPSRPDHLQSTSITSRVQ